MHEGANEGIGELLRNERAKRNISLEDVSEATGISRSIIRALEEEDRERLPAEVYIKAFYKKYAEFLNLAPEEVLAKFPQPDESKQRKSGDSPNFQTVVKLKVPEENPYFDTIRLLVVSVLVILLGIFFYWAFKTNFNPIDYFGSLLEPVDVKGSDRFISS
jgi:cytoskeleton protein RodZ